jgi:hypothetical protein
VLLPGHSPTFAEEPPSARAQRIDPLFFRRVPSAYQGHRIVSVPRSVGSRLYNDLPVTAGLSSSRNPCWRWELHSAWRSLVGSVPPSDRGNS